METWVHLFACMVYQYLEGNKLSLHVSFLLDSILKFLASFLFKTRIAIFHSYNTVKSFNKKLLGYAIRLVRETTANPTFCCGEGWEFPPNPKRGNSIG
ncbi:MAG TPA: hypothetical protein DGQ38_17930 [Zunongwangia profunda]|uniref:Uncharacterized protein n=1 Tax=Zunongwangia profunda TaxID=398743 RepID=A0A3D5J496_9FLAO|nr:hypothetical protein [Zunongwangia profunda]